MTAAARAAGSIAIGALGVLLSFSPAHADEEGQAAVLSDPDSPGVSASATFSYVTQDFNQSTGVANSPAPSGLAFDPAYGGSNDPIIPTEVPESDYFSAGYLTIPDPCVRRKYGGQYCEAAAPQPDVKGKPQPKAQAPPPPSPEEIARIAIDRAVALAPDPDLEVAPARIGLTGLESYFWLAEPPTTITATAGVPGLVVTAQATPVQFVWDFGDGEELVTTSAGTRWSPHSKSGISHLYETKGVYELSVEVIWAASYQVNGGTSTPIGHFSTSDQRRYPVQEMVAVLVPSD